MNRCGLCGAGLVSEARFCDRCGNAVRSEAAEVPHAHSDWSFSKSAVGALIGAVLLVVVGIGIGFAWWTVRDVSVAVNGRAQPSAGNQQAPPTALAGLRGVNWTDVPPGREQRGIRFDSDKMTVSVGTTVIARYPKAPNGYFERTLLVSPSSPSKGLVLIVLWEDQEGGVNAVVVGSDGRVVASSFIPDGWVLARDWVVWSPDEEYAVVSPAGEVTMGDLVLASTHSIGFRTNLPLLSI